MEKVFTVAVLGAGARGFSVYGRLINEKKDKFREDFIDNLFE